MRQMKGINFPHSMHSRSYSFFINDDDNRKAAHFQLQIGNACFKYHANDKNDKRGKKKGHREQCSNRIFHLDAVSFEGNET